MNKKSQALIIISWVLAILTVLAVSIGHRVSIALRLSRFHRDSLKAFYLAKAGVNLAIGEINKNLNTADNNWANNENLFKRIAINDNQDEFATVSYNSVNDGNGRTVYGVLDEESKININAASSGLIKALLDEYNINIGTPNDELAANICAWQGIGKPPNYDDLGYRNKGARFSNIEELMLVKGVTPEILDTIREATTVYGSGKVNINAASRRILLIIFRSVSAPSDQNLVEAKVNDIIKYRSGYDAIPGTIDDKVFENLEKVQSTLFTSPEESGLFSSAQGLLTVSSDAFRIEATGTENNLTKRITAVYDRKAKKLEYWHEN